MRGVRSFLPFAAPLTLLAGCGVEREPTASLDRVAPSSAYSDAATAIALVGGPFRPPLEVDTQSGAAEVGGRRFAVFLVPLNSPGAPAIAALDARWRTTEEIDARVPEGLPPGQYIVQMNDPRGQPVRSTGFFTSLGPDNDGPVITFLHPDADSAYGAGEKVSVSAEINDGAGHVRWARWSGHSDAPWFGGGDCAVAEDQPGKAPCTFSFAAPTVLSNLQAVDIRVDAWDSVQNYAFATRRIRVAWSPHIDSVTPAAGPTTGGTEIKVTGTGFIPNLSQILIDGVPIGGAVNVSEGSIMGTTNPHVPSTNSVVTVANGGSTSGDATFQFQFISPPKLREVSPRHGAPDAWTQVTLAGDHLRPEATFYWSQNGSAHPIVPDPLPDPLPDTPLVTYDNESRVFITLPRGTGVISIIVSDPVSGRSELTNIYRYDDAPVP